MSIAHYRPPGRRRVNVAVSLGEEDEARLRQQLVKRIEQAAGVSRYSGRGTPKSTRVYAYR